MLTFEADLGLLQGADQPGVSLVACACETAFHFAVEARQLLLLFTVPGTADGLGEFVEQTPQVLFHDRNATGPAACT